MCPAGTENDMIRKGRRGKDQLQRRSGPLYLIPWSPCNRNRSDRPEGLPLRFLNKERQVYSERSMPIHGFCSRPFPRLSLPISTFSAPAKLPLIPRTIPGFKDPVQGERPRPYQRSRPRKGIYQKADAYAWCPEMLFSPMEYPLHRAFKS